MQLRATFERNRQPKKLLDIMQYSTSKIYFNLPATSAAVCLKSAFLYWLILFLLLLSPIVSVVVC